jgi:hypothetical protein
VRGGISTKGKQERKMVDLLQTWGFHKKDLYSPLKTREKKITLWDFSARLLKRETRTATMSEKKNRHCSARHALFLLSGRGKKKP